MMEGSLKKPSRKLPHKESTSSPAVQREGTSGQQKGVLTSARPISAPQIIQLQKMIGNQLTIQLVRQSQTVVQRLKDKDQQPVTMERVLAETNVATLNEWKELDNEEWDSDEEDAIKEAIVLRIAELEPSKLEEEVVPEKVKDKIEPSIQEVLSVKLKGLHKGNQAKFLEICSANSLDPITAADDIIREGTSAIAVKRALTALALGATLERTIWLAREYEGLMSLKMDTISVNMLVPLLNEGFLVAKKITYCDTPLKSGSVYVFQIKHTDDVLRTEWHVHWGPKNKAEASSFKNKRMATGPGARVTTSEGESRSMKTELGPIWGP